MAAVRPAYGPVANTPRDQTPVLQQVRKLHVSHDDDDAAVAVVLLVLVLRWRWWGEEQAVAVNAKPRCCCCSCRLLLCGSKGHCCGCGCCIDKQRQGVLTPTAWHAGCGHEHRDLLRHQRMLLLLLVMMMVVDAAERGIVRSGSRWRDGVIVAG